MGYGAKTLGVPGQIVIECHFDVLLFRILVLCLPVLVMVERVNDTRYIYTLTDLTGREDEQCRISAASSLGFSATQRCGSIRRLVSQLNRINVP